MVGWGVNHQIKVAMGLVMLCTAAENRNTMEVGNNQLTQE